MPREEFIRLRVADWEKFWLQQEADKAGLSLSAYVRETSLRHSVVVFEGLDELARELRYQGNNLNQLTIMARQGRVEQINYEPFMEAYTKVWQALNSLQSRRA